MAANMLFTAPPSSPPQAVDVSLYLRSGYIHQVRSYKGNRSISATMLFTASLDDTFDGSTCENETYEYRPLSEAKVHWTYNKGDKTIDMGYQNVEKFRQTILSGFEELKVMKTL